MEIGALLAGVILSTSPYATEISSKIRPLRDFFLIIFFIILGLKIEFSSFGSIIVNALIFSGIALFLKPLILMGFMRIFGYTKRTNFMLGVTLSQISEFSIIVLGMGVAMSYVLPEVVNTIVLTLILTILISTYFTIYSDKLYKVFSRFLIIFENKKVRARRRERRINKEYDAILFGYNRIGFNLLNSLKKLKRSYLVVDFNPDVVKDLTRFRIPSLYGDAFDLELLEDLPLKKVKIVVSTIPEIETNKLLLQVTKSINPKALMVLRAHTIEDARTLYEAGADYVLTPHFLGGEYLARMLKHYGTDKKDYKMEKRKHLKLLDKYTAKGYRHPEVEK